MKLLQDYNNALSRENNKYGIGWQMLSFLAAVLYPLFNKIDMMFRRAGAMRCNHIVLHHRGTSKEINGGGKGEVFPLFLVSHAFEHRTLEEPCWIWRLRCTGSCSKICRCISSKCIFSMLIRNSLHKVKSGPAQMLLILLLRRRHTDKSIAPVCG